MERIFINRTIFLFTILFIFCVNLVHAQETSLDWHISEIGPIRQIITNMGNFGPGLTAYSGIYSSTEYPIGSYVLYGPFAPWIGAKRWGQVLVSSGGPWCDRWTSVNSNDIGHFGNRHELFPTASPWDSVWVVNNRETVDIPF